MEWLQVGVVISLVVIWMSAVLVVLAILSVGRRGEDETGAAHCSLRGSAHGGLSHSLGRSRGAPH